MSQGQQVFLNNGLMEYGSVFGHGAYLGPDYTADYLRRSSDLVRDLLRRRVIGSAVQKTIEDLRTNRYDEKTDTLTFSARQAAAFRKLVPYYSDFFSDPKTVHGLRPDAITDADGAAAADGLLRLDGLGGGGRAARATTTRTRTTGRPSLASTTSRPPT